MKDHIHCFVVFTILEIAFSTFYYLLVRTVNATLVVGALLYAACMATGYFSYRKALYKERRRQLLDALP